MKIKLYEHQKLGRDLLLKHRKYCLFYEVGTGKTFTALSALMELPSGKVLIAAPKRVLEGVWKKDDNYDLSKHDVTYLNYEKIARDKNFQYRRFDYIVLDEVHRLKGRTTKTSRKFRQVTLTAQYVWGLTGTPQANSYADVYNIYRNMNIVEFDMNYDEFVARYYFTKDMMSDSGYPFKILLDARKDRLPELIFRIGKHSTVKRIKDCIDLPDKRTEIVKIPGMVSKKYKEIEKGILSYDDYEKTMIKLEQINKLHQAANGFVYDLNSNPIVLTNKNPKFEYLKDMLEDMLEQTERVIIVYYYKYDLEVLKQLKYSWTIDPNDFPNKQILFLQAGQAEGLNLQYCNYMIFYTYDYSFLKFEQMSGRIYRDGQKNNVVYTILISDKTIEEKIWWAIKNKKSRDEFLKEALKDE